MTDAKQEARPPRQRVAVRAVSSLTFVAGAALALVFLHSILPFVVVPLVAIALGGLDALRPLVRDASRWRRALGVIGWIGCGVAYALWMYLAIAWGSVLAWTIPPWGWAALSGAAIGVLLTLHPRWRGPRVAPALPIGMWIALCLLGWRVEESVARCDDYREVRAADDLELVSPTNGDFDACTPGEVVDIGRFPRGIWQSASGDRLIVATSAGQWSEAPESARFTGSLCEVRGDAPPQCIGDGKVQGIAESRELGRLFVANYGRFESGMRGRVIALPLDGPFEIAAETQTRRSLHELFYDPRADRLYGLTDEGFEAIPIVASTLTQEAPRPVPVISPGGVRYDQARGEGLICAASGPLVTLDGEPYLSLAIRGNPFEVRPIGSGALARASLTWGCDLDVERRLAYVAIPNLGLLATIDYDSGEVQRTHYVGFGMRSVTLDRDRRLLYVTNFLAGYVAALDVDSMEEVARWHPGRFPRTARISRDGARLWVGTNLGVVAIRLPERDGGDR